jgi:hypothetical protein
VQRQLAKALNFGLLYGMGAASLQTYARVDYRIDLTERQAAAYRERFFRTYPGLRRWHREVGSSRSTETRTLGGRRRLLSDETSYTQTLRQSRGRGPTASKRLSRSCGSGARRAPRPRLSSPSTTSSSPKCPQRRPRPRRRGLRPQ